MKYMAWLMCTEIERKHSTSNDRCLNAMSLYVVFIYEWKYNQLIQSTSYLTSNES